MQTTWNLLVEIIDSVGDRPWQHKSKPPVYQSYYKSGWQADVPALPTGEVGKDWINCKNCPQGTLEYAGGFEYCTHCDYYADLTDEELLEKGIDV